MVSEGLIKFSFILLFLGFGILIFGVILYGVSDAPSVTTTIGTVMVAIGMIMMLASIGTLVIAY
jgi:hypothetical protein